MADDERIICSSAALVDGADGVRFEVDTKRGPLAAFAVRFGGQVFGYLNRCAHIGVELDWNPGKFFDDSGLYLICATHGALYEPRTGYCIEGPCRGAHLQALHVEERDGNIYLVTHS